MGTDDLQLLAARTGRPLAHEVASRLQRRIASGDWAVGQRLPPERSLVREMSVSRTVLREALASLEMLGLVVSRPGDGRYVSDGPVRHGDGDALVGAWLARHGARMRELDEIKAALEPLALRSAHPAALTGIADGARQALREQREALERQDAVAAADADARFHTALCSGTPNRPLQDLTIAFIEAVRVPGIAVFAVSGNGERSVGQHAIILDALDAGDLEGAAASLERHTRDPRRWEERQTSSLAPQTMTRRTGGPVGSA
jgi:GntR family transcriptional repressor for pyruvate dehydrogenase complex